MTSSARPGRSIWGESSVEAVSARRPPEISRKGGARVFVGPTPPATQPRSLTQQVAEFQNYVDNGDVTFDPSTSLFFLLGGLNDHNLVTSAQVNAATASQVATLYSLGARIFEIALLPASVPAFTDSPDNFNPGYEALVPELQAEYPDATFNLSNWGPDYDYIHDNPSIYGLTNTTDPCNNFTTTCATPNNYFYYCVDHPSTYVHQIVGNELYNEVLASLAGPRAVDLGDDGARLPGSRLRRLSRRENEGGRRLRRLRAHSPPLKPPPGRLLLILRGFLLVDARQGVELTRWGAAA
jgi:hypothetical protein